MSVVFDLGTMTMSPSGSQMVLELVNSMGVCSESGMGSQMVAS